MSIVVKQSFFNLITIGIAFIIGAVNTLYLYPTFLGSKLQGLVIALLAISNLIQPFLSFGTQHAVIRFYSRYKSKKEKDARWKKKWPQGNKLPTQQYLADKYGCSVGTMNKLMKSWQKWIEGEEAIRKSRNRYADAYAYIILKEDWPEANITLSQIQNKHVIKYQYSDSYGSS